MRIGRTIYEIAATKFAARPGTYLLIPCVAALVGWFTNYLAVKMIFYPIQYRGLSLWRQKENPLGVFGWQGIVPCKTVKMSETMINMVTSQLLTVKEAFYRLDAKEVAQLLEPEIESLGEEILDDVVPTKWMSSICGPFIKNIPQKSKSILKPYNIQFLTNLTLSMQENIDSIFNINNCVVNQMIKDRSLLGKLFCKCGQKELNFLTNSGIWFGFILGIIQMIVALFYDNPWTLSIGGCIVGLATNWLALKWIFEPVNPTRFGPFTLQGQFLRRQKEVSKEFSNFFAAKILTSKEIWKTILSDPETYPAFHDLFANNLKSVVEKIGINGVRIINPGPKTLNLITERCLYHLPNHVSVVHEYVDETMGLEETLRIEMENMSSEQFEQVLHPIFQEDETTLILAGAGLGFAAGLFQQGLETGTIALRPIHYVIKTYTFMTKKSSIMLILSCTLFNYILNKKNVYEKIKIRSKIKSIRKKVNNQRNNLLFKSEQHQNTTIIGKDHHQPTIG